MIIDTIFQPGPPSRIGAGLPVEPYPPYVMNRSQTSAQGYDPEKASPIGRMMSVQATIRW